MEQAVEDPLIDRPRREPVRSCLRQAKTLRPVAHGAFRFRAELTHFLVFAPRGSVTLFAHDDTGKLKISFFISGIDKAFAANFSHVALDQKESHLLFAVDPLLRAAVADTDQ